MGLPKHIEEELKQAEEDFAAVYPDRAPKSEEGTQDTEATAEADESKEEAVIESEATTEGLEANTPEPNVEETEHDNTAELADYKHRYSVLKGKYNKEVPRLTQKISELQSKVSNMEIELSNTANSSSVIDDSELVKALRNDFGSDVVDEVLSNIEPKEVKSDIDDGLAARVETAEKAAADTKFEMAQMALDRILPGWREQNNDPLFHDWLGGLDEFSGVVRQELLETSFNNSDYERVKRIFDRYKSDSAQSAPPLSPETKPRQQRIIPETSGEEAASDVRTYSKSDIDSFYADVRKGKYRGKESDGEAIERDIFKAQKEGRVIG